ncbi:hypothetical protein NQ315_012060 [Exocentrus adspersus]|uniref:Elongator complex protein 4 n=1 Tax=Exocentrus adspersus TaxID=1586481 RepID=A0AAV8VZM9_9CUCU|nr:hypothetical protein NQ315_012060 [Exocentrus adspersus]
MEKNIQKSIPGTTFSTQNGQLLTSSGVPSLDSLLEEDFHGLYSKILLKYFLAEGIVTSHSTFVASQDTNPSSIVKELPAVIDSDSEPETDVQKISGNSNKMKIAFRCQNLPTDDLSDNFKHIGHFYDLSKNILKLKMESSFLKDNPERRSLLRIGIHSLGSPMWLPHSKSVHSIDSSRDLNLFIFCLRALVRSAYAVAVITIPTHLYHEISLDRCIHSSDIAIRLQAFSGTELENNQSLSDYHGFFYLTKLAAINSLASRHPGSVEYAFKLRRKKFTIEMLHLPPDIGEDRENKKEKVPSLACGGSNNHLLEF